MPIGPNGTIANQSLSVNAAKEASSEAWVCSNESSSDTDDFKLSSHNQLSSLVLSLPDP